MNRNDRYLLAALALAGVTAIFVLLKVLGAFDGPAGHGWVYNFQTLIAASLALIAAAAAIVAAKLTIKHQQKAEADRINADMIARLRVLVFEMREVSIHTLGRLEFALGENRTRWLADIANRREDIMAAVKQPAWLSETASALNWNYGIAAHLFYSSARIAAENIHNDATLPLSRKRLFYAQLALRALHEALASVEEGRQLPRRPVCRRMHEIVQVARELGVTELEPDTTADLFLDPDAFNAALSR